MSGVVHSRVGCPLLTILLVQGDMVEMTGSVAVGKRGDSWQSKRVFFLTPQVRASVGVFQLNMA